MAFIQIYIQGLVLIVIFFSIIWLISVLLKNASIVDIFWGVGYILANGFYFYSSPGHSVLKTVTLILVTIWGMRLSLHIFFRNFGKPEDYRYKEFRRKYGEHRYWWFSFFQVFLLQGILVWLISSPLLAINFYSPEHTNLYFMTLGILVWLVGFVFEAGGDWQLMKFKAEKKNKGKLLQTGFWKYTRHPNYFGDAAVWWGFGLLAMASGSFWPVFSSILMTWLIVKISGVALLERAMKSEKQGYEDYVKRTSAFIPWFPGKNK